MSTRKIAAISISAAMILAVVGCGVTEEDVTASTADYTVDESTVDISVQTSESKGSDISSAASSGSSIVPVSSDSATVLSDDAFDLNGKTVSILDDTKGILEAVRASYTDISDTDKDITYYDFCTDGGDSLIHITSFKSEGKESPIELVVQTPGIKTSRGIEIGSSKEDVIAAYGQPEAGDSKDLLKYSFDGFSIQFTTFDDCVKYIYYYNTATHDKFYDSQK